MTYRTPFSRIVQIIIIICTISIAFMLIPARIRADESFLYDFARDENMNAAMRPIDPTRILTPAECRAVVDDLSRASRRRSVNSRQNLVIFRLAVNCGLRVSEIAGLQLRDVHAEGGRPHIVVRKEIAKRNKARKVALWWERNALECFRLWKAERLAQGAKASDPLVCMQAKASRKKNGGPSGSQGDPLNDRNVQNRWRVAIRALGPERVAELSIHCGRHTFCSLALHGGRNLAQVRDAAGHANIATTSIYLHSVDDDAEQAGSTFGF